MTGRNENNSGAVSNGAGKSALVMAALWCLTGQSDIRLMVIINSCTIQSLNLNKNINKVLQWKVLFMRETIVKVAITAHRINCLLNLWPCTWLLRHVHMQYVSLTGRLTQIRVWITLAWKLASHLHACQQIKILRSQVLAVPDYAVSAIIGLQCSTGCLCCAE